MIKFTNAFTKITGWPIQKLCFRTKIYYEDKAVQGRNIKGKAIVMCNHTSVYDYACLLFVFFSRTLRCQMADVLFKKNNLLSAFLKQMGGIKIDRENKNFDFITKSLQVLDNDGVLEVFPESRLPKKDELTPLEFKPSITYIALSSNAPIIPVYTNGSYFKSKRARVIIGKPINVNDYYDNNLSEKENVDKITKLLREKTIYLRELLNEKTKK